MKILNHEGKNVKLTKVFGKFHALACGEEGRGRSIGFIGIADDLLTEDLSIERASVIKTKSGKFLLIPEKDKTDNRIILVTQWYGGFRGSLSHNVNELEKEGKLQILTQGETAQGDAGRMGGETQFILLLKQPCQIHYCKNGRVYGGERDWVINYDGKSINHLSKVEWDNINLESKGGELICSLNLK